MFKKLQQNARKRKKKSKNRMENFIMNRSELRNHGRQRKKKLN